MEKKRYKDSDYIIYADGRCYSNKSHKFLTPKMSAKYPSYNLTLDGNKKAVKVHRMVAETFIEQPEGKNIVNHKDGDTHNFKKENLEWVTAQENSLHAREAGLSTNNDQTAVLLQDNLIPGEIWVPLIGFDNYNISNYGRIVNKNTKRIKKTPLDNNGYPHTNLWKDGKGKTFQVHRIEFQSFYPEEDLEGFVINHIDGDKTNNKLSNLEKTTYAENNLHAEYISKTHACAKAVLQLDIDGNIISEYPSIKEAEAQTKTSCISRAIRNNYCANGFYWKFKN